MRLSATILPLEEAARLVPELDLEHVACASGAPPPRGFRPEHGPPVVAVVRDGSGALGLALLRWYRLWLGPRRYCRLALVSRVMAIAEGASTGDRLELIHRGLLDALTRSDQPAHFISILVSAGTEERIDQLWRLALALNARCTIRDRGSELAVELVLPGVRGELGASISTMLERRFWSRVSTRLRSRHARRSVPPMDEAQAFFVLDLRQPPVAAAARNDVEFAEIPAGELQRRPGRYGFSLLAAGSSSVVARCFAGTMGGQVVFRMWTNDVHDRLVGSNYRDVFAQVKGPAALIFSAFTVPEFRGRSIYPAALAWLAERYRVEGYESLCLFAQVNNPSALRGAEKGGFRRVL